MLYNIDLIISSHKITNTANQLTNEQYLCDDEFIKMHQI